MADEPAPRAVQQGVLANDILHLELDSQAVQVTNHIRLVKKPETPEDRFKLSDKEKEARIANLRARFEAATQPAKRTGRSSLSAWILGISALVALGLLALTLKR